MGNNSQISTNPLIAKVHQLFSQDLALENDFLGRKTKSSAANSAPACLSPKPTGVFSSSTACQSRIGLPRSFYRQARNSPGLEPASETKEVDLRQAFDKTW